LFIATGCWLHSFGRNPSVIINHSVIAYSDSTGLPLTYMPDTDSSGKKFKNRQWLIGGLTAAAYGSSLIILNDTWFKGYAHTSFHVFDDDKEWLQIDKAGHMWTAYSAGRASTALWEWAGLSHQK